MIFVTGDVHGFKHTAKFSSTFFLNTINKPENILLITGDFGVTWTKEAMQKSIEFYGKFKCKFLFIDGNNENYDILNSLPVEEMYGGKVHKISDNIIHLMRGQIFEIEGVKILAFGGADSYDAPIRCSTNPRVNHINWWKEECPTKEEFNEALTNLKKHNNKVDIILTHETTSANIAQNYYWSIRAETCSMLDEIDRIADYKMWYFGHHHIEGHPSGNTHQQCIFTSFDNITYVAEHQPYKSEVVSGLGDDDNII